MSWDVVCEPVGENPGLIDKAKAALGGDQPTENTGGIVVYVTSGSTKQEVGRVAYMRRVSVNPKTTFDKALQDVVEKARTACKMLNGDLSGDGKLQ